jgi:imidazolonepropionase-like amidohydrolase
VTDTGWLVADSLWWDGRLRTGGALQLHDGVVTGVADAPGPGPLRRLPGTLLPGLCDAHVHSALVDLGTVRAGGIAAVWDLGGVPDVVTALRDRAARPGSGLPRMTVAGPFLTAPGGYPSDRPWAPAGSWREVRSAADAADAVAECRAAGAELIKVTAHTGGPTLSRAELTAVVEAAHTAGTPVVVHAEGRGTVEAAVDAGVDVLAHTPWTQRLDDGALRAAAGLRMCWISTLDIHGWGRPSPELGTAVDNLRRFLGYGGRIRYGTDLGNGPLVPGVNPREIRALQQAGLTPEDVLAAMTADSDGLPPSWIAGGLDLDTTRFADVLATARVVGPEVRPRPA